MDGVQIIQPTLTDGELLQRSKARDDDAFAALVDRHKDLLVNYLTRLTGSRSQAEELAQETFVRLFRHLDRYRDQGTLVAYLLRIGTNLVRSAERRRARWRLLRPLLDARIAPAGISPSGSSQEGEVLASEAQREVTRAIAELDLRFRAPLVLREIEGLSYREIARALGCSEGTVKSRLFRARALLKTRLTPYWKGANAG